MSSDQENAISILNETHCDNAKNHYYAESARGRVSVTPLTSFIFEYFIFNSLYSQKWDPQNALGQDEQTESKKQRDFIKHIKSLAISKPSLIYRAFDSFLYCPEFEGEWTSVKPDSRISKENGDSFFKKMRVLKEMIQGCGAPDKMQTSNKFWDIIEHGVYFISNVRNNVFHGSKSLGDIWDSAQIRRIEAYEMFLRCVVSLFFLCHGQERVASDYNNVPLSIGDVPIRRENVIKAIYRNKTMKEGDTKLIAHLRSIMPSPSKEPEPNSSLFYPSSGHDIITPLLLGLPYCRNFYFYEVARRSDPQLHEIFCNIQGTRRGSPPQPMWSDIEGEANIKKIKFNYSGIERNLYIVQRDNTDFLKRDTALTFYFHRGDSPGEGGSGQNWDSEKMAALAQKVPVDQNCFFVSDGEPGGLASPHIKDLQELNIPFLERSRKYYCGYIANRI